ncbi:MAG: SMC-Scp complex subunit ScpB [Lachnospira sp.]|nr:SMC-Scp complex subunit ScpB [Lachnospira sp.]
MELEQLLGAIEAILFSMGEAVPVKDIAVAIEQDEDTTIKLIHNLMDKLNQDKRGIQIIELDDAVQMCTKTEYYNVLTKLINQPKKHVLSDVMLETLSIIAYRQPVTRQQIETIRGVKCDHAVNKLIEYNLVCEVGRLEAPGRPILFGTTTDFLRCFGVASVDDLPTVDSVKLEDFKQEAIAEAQMELDV